MTVSSLASLASSMQQAQLRQELEAGVAKLALDNAEAQGKAVVEMIEGPKAEINDLQAHLGNVLDTKA